MMMGMIFLGLSAVIAIMAITGSYMNLFGWKGLDNVVNLGAKKRQA